MTTGSALSTATRRSILLLSFATFASMAAQRICDAMLPELSRTFAVSLAQAAQVVSVFAVVYGLAQLFYGPLGARLSKFGIVTFATLACCVGSLVSVFAGSLHMLVLARVGLGTTLGIVCAQLVGGSLTDTLGWRWAFGLMTLLFGVVGSLLYVDRRRQQAAYVPVTSTEPIVRPGFVTQALIIITGSVVAHRAGGRLCRGCGRLRRAGHLGIASAQGTGHRACRCRRPASSWRCSVWAACSTRRWRAT